MASEKTDRLRFTAMQTDARGRFTGVRRRFVVFTVPKKLPDFPDFAHVRQKAYAGQRDGDL